MTIEKEVNGVTVKAIVTHSGDIEKAIKTYNELAATYAEMANGYGEMAKGYAEMKKGYEAMLRFL